MASFKGNRNHSIIMIGPHPSGQGGISKVLSEWQRNYFFHDFNIVFIPSVKENKNKYAFLIKNLFLFFIACLKNHGPLYLHTASFNSFYRKSVFIMIGVMFKKKIFLHIHPNYFQTFISRLNGINKLYSKFILRRISVFIVLTNEVKKFISTNFPRKPVYILRNPVCINDFNYTIRNGRSKNRILFLGWFVKEKGIYDLVTAFRHLKERGVNANCVFYGTKNIDTLKAFVKKNKLNDCVTVNGWISGLKKIEELKRCTLIALPSYTEGIPNVILEAMASKTPIIATSEGGLKEILIDQYNSILCKKQDPYDLSNKIEFALCNENVRNTIAKNAFGTLTRFFDSKIIKNEMQKMLKNESVY